VFISPIFSGQSFVAFASALKMGGETALSEAERREMGYYFNAFFGGK
jgi:hypothetical protein